MAYDPAIQSFVQRTLDDVSFGCKFLPSFVVERRTPAIRELLSELRCVQHNPNANSSVHIANIQLAGETYSIHYAKQINKKKHHINNINKTISLYYDPSFDPDTPPGIAVSAINSINELKVIKDNAHPANLSKVYGADIVCHADILNSTTILDCDEIHDIPHSIAQKVNDISIDEVIPVAKVDLTSNIDGVENTETYDILCKKTPNGQQLEASMGDTPQQIVLSYPAVEFNMDKHDISNLLSNISIYKDVNDDIQASVEPHSTQLDCSGIHVNFDSNEVRKCVIKIIEVTDSSDNTEDGPEDDPNDDTDIIPQLSIIEQIQDLDHKKKSDLDINDIVVKIATVEAKFYQDTEVYTIYFKADINGIESVRIESIVDGNGNIDRTHIIYANAKPDDDSALKIMLYNIKFYGYQDGYFGPYEVRVHLDGSGKELDCENSDFNESEPQECAPIQSLNYLPIIEQVNELGPDVHAQVDIGSITIRLSYVSKPSYSIYFKYGNNISCTLLQKAFHVTDSNKLVITHNDTKSLTAEELSNLLNSIRIYKHNDTDDTMLFALFDHNGIHMECKAESLESTRSYPCGEEVRLWGTDPIKILEQVNTAADNTKTIKSYNFPVLIAYMNAADSLFPEYRVYLSNYDDSKSNFVTLDNINKTITIHSVSNQYSDSYGLARYALKTIFISANNSEMCHRDASKNKLETGQPCYNEPALQKCLSLHTNGEKYDGTVIPDDIITISGETSCYQGTGSLLTQVHHISNVYDNVEIGEISIKGHICSVVLEYTGILRRDGYPLPDTEFSAETTLDTDNNPAEVLITFAAPSTFISNITSAELTDIVEKVRIYTDEDDQIDAAYMENIITDDQQYLNCNGINFDSYTEAQRFTDISNVGPLYTLEKVKVSGLKIHSNIQIAKITLDGNPNYTLWLEHYSSGSKAEIDIQNREIKLKYHNTYSLTEADLRDVLRHVRFYRKDYYIDANDNQCYETNSDNNIEVVLIGSKSDYTSAGYGGGNPNSYINCSSVNFFQTSIKDCEPISHITKLSIIQQINIAMYNAYTDDSTLTPCHDGYKTPIHIATISNSATHLTGKSVYLTYSSSRSSTYAIWDHLGIHIETSNHGFSNSASFVEKVLTTIYYRYNSPSITSTCYYNTLSNNSPLPSDSHCNENNDNNQGCIDLYNDNTIYDSHDIPTVGLLAPGDPYCLFE